MKTFKQFVSETNTDEVHEPIVSESVKKKKIVPSSRWGSGIDNIGPGNGHHIAHGPHKIYWDADDNLYHGYTNGKLVAKSDPTHKGASGRANLAKKLQESNIHDIVAGLNIVRK